MKTFKKSLLVCDAKMILPNQTGKPLHTEGLSIMKLIPLSKTGKHKGKYSAMVDDEDFEWLNKINWSLVTKGKLQNKPYAYNQKTKGRSILMHRIILGVVDANVHIDHVDGNGLNNQRSNLRICTHAQNMANKKSVGTSKYLGVVLCTYKRKKDASLIIRWTAKVNKNNKRTYLGCFKTEEEAALAYNKKAIELHGEFANLNIISNLK